MTHSDHHPLSHGQEKLDAVIKTAQYLAGLQSERDIWAELGKVAVHFLGADLAAFVTRRTDGQLVLHHCVAAGTACSDLVKATNHTMRQVFENGFLATEQVNLGEDYALAFLALNQGTAMGAVMIIGHRQAEPLSRKTLNLYLAVAGLFRSTLTRLSSQHRFIAMANNVPEMLFQLVRYPDGAFQFAYVSEGSRATLAVTPTELLADGDCFFSRLLPEDREDFEAATRLTRTVGRVNRVFRWQDQDGNERHILFNAMPTLQEDGSIVWDGAVQDVTERERLEEQRKQFLLRLERSMETTVEAMASTIERRDPYTAGHQRRVADLAAHIARELELPEEEVHGIFLAASIHDVGKIHVPAEILSFPGKLGLIEFDLVKTHAQVGYEILKVIEFPWPVAEMVLQHHERLNGSGYPRGLKADQIITGARIITVADVVESIASFRPYRPAFGTEKALEEVTQQRGVLYDPLAVDACQGLFEEKGYKLPSV
ncbi:HD-GYP domain-containing protein [Thiohalomonas denitrificans]|uniref:HD-GYP domain-containing protein n=1 Tax=Thiohalomonas denitrificans TaxID=415747 RepID=UPI0026EE8685|nr:HD domain-containing phosphohydrolase [Thiohalomonas denitrificans]